MTQKDAPAPDADAAEVMKSRLRTDLRAAMVAQDPLRVRALRALVAALDNAQAVPVGDQHLRYVVQAFGEAEVPRLRLGEAETRALLARQADALGAAAAEMRRLGHEERAQDLEREAALTAGYL